MQIGLVLAVTAFLAAAQDKAPEKDNPQFKYWTEWKPGAWVKHKMEMEQGGQKVEMETMIKLLEITAEKVTTENTGKMKLPGGREMATPAQKQELKAKDSKMGNIDKEGDEEIEVGGKKLKAHWLQISMEQGGKKMSARVWLCKEIPGGMAKNEVTPDGATMPTMKFQAVEWGDK